MADSASYLIHSDRGTALAADVPEVREHSRPRLGFTSSSSTEDELILDAAADDHQYHRSPSLLLEMSQESERVPRFREKGRVYSPHSADGTKRMAADTVAAALQTANSCCCHFSCQKGISPLLMSAFSAPSAQLSNALSLPLSHKRTAVADPPTHWQAGSRGAWVRQAAAWLSRVMAAAKAGAAGGRGCSLCGVDR